MSLRGSGVACLSAQPSAPVELAWVLDLVVQTAPYAAPALDELDSSLLPGVAALRSSVRERYESLWGDRLAGCPELLAVADAGGCATDDDARPLLTWLSTLPRQASIAGRLSSEPPPSRRLIRRRLARLDSDVRLRRAYRDLLADVWRLVRPAWERRGRAVAGRAAGEWSRRLSGVKSASALLQLMPPRHPLNRVGPEWAARLFRRRPRYDLVPIYNCMSGGLLTDLGDRLLIGVPASALEPVRRTRDALFVADRSRVLAEPTRVQILIQLMSAPAGVMEITRALHMTQPTVSEHVRVLVAAGAIRRRRKESRTVYVASPHGVERLFEDARATLGRWMAVR